MNLKNATENFFNSFSSNHVILYVGQTANDDDLKAYISKCPWSAVITSRRDTDFVTFFSDQERTPYEYTSRNELPAKPLSRKKLPILRLLGVQGEDKEQDDLSWLRTNLGNQKNSTLDIDNARDMLRLLPEILDHVNPFVVIGANSEIDWELFGNELTYLLYTATSEGSVSIWDMPSVAPPKCTAAYETLKKVVNMKKFNCYEVSLAEVIRSRSNEINQFSIDETSLPEQDSDVYYQGCSPVNVTQGDLLLFKNVGTLLTERTINRIRPLGRVMSRKWFSNFLESSASMGPQWYGYLPQSTFYVKRSYEDALVQLVRKMLEGRGITGNTAVNRPVILTGDPGSSKSITLAALAYRIFSEKKYPVIFISKDSFLSSNIGTGLEELDEAMQLLEKKAETDTRILVIWDSSAYKSGIERAQSLLERLQNRGRRFVLVCSSYNMYSRKDEDDTGNYHLLDGNSGIFEPCDNQTAQVYDRSGCYFVKAIRQMNTKEQVEFWKIVKEYSGINDATISQFKKKISDEKRTEIFEYYYLLITVLRDNLEQGLRSEQSKVFPYVEKELKKAIGEIQSDSQKDKRLSPIYQAFLAAGLDVSSIAEAENIANDLDDTLTKNLDMFNMCVALFSRFKLSVPYGLAYTILIGENCINQYNESNRNLYRIVTTEIPWIYYGEDENGDFTFRFRNPLEADIFLRNHDFTGEKQIDLLCNIIDIYGTDYRRSKCKDLTFTDNLQALLRLMGPNSGYTPFQTSRKFEHDSILKRLNYLIEKLEDLQKEYGVPDEDASFASIIVTFTREYYSSIWNNLFSSSNSELERWEYDSTHFSPENYEFRIMQLISAITLAEHSIEAIEMRIHAQDANYFDRQHLTNQRNSLAVEITQCNMRLEDLIVEYQRCCYAHKIKSKENLTNRRLHYQVIYQQLWPVIASNPTNGYAYNALFKAFEREYEKGNLSEVKKLQYLSEIMQVVETCEALDSEIISRGGFGIDELTDHINRIKDFSTGLKINLSSICRHRKGIPAANAQEEQCFELFDEMLEANNAAAITFICQKELRIPKSTRQLDTDQLLRCRTVYDFMNEADNFECVCSNAYALAMLIRVSWMLYNETTLTSSPECQLTKLNRKEWVNINRLCSIYNEIAGDKKQPLIILLYALSALQVSELSEYGYQEALNILGTLSEEMFYQRRMWTPFMLCDDNGVPYEFSGTVLSIKENSGFIRVNGIPQRLNKDVGVRFHRYNLGKGAKMPEPKQVLRGLELGVGFTCFSVYTPAGRKEREAKS